MWFLQKGSPADKVEKANPVSPQGAGGLLLVTVWFGLVAGFLELGFVLAQRAVNPHLPMDALRTNRQFVWMIAVSDLLIFAVVGLCIALLARFRPGLAQRLAFWLPVGLTFLTLLLTIEGLYAIACVVLACGLASTISPWLGHRSERFARFVRVSFPALALGLVVLTGVTYQRVMSAERRALSLYPPAAPDAPNVLLIVLDDVRADSLSLYGHRNPTTPNLERLARKGVAFTEARSTAPWSLPSHASIMTGRWPHELSVGPDLPLDRTFPTLAETLGREGYATAGFVGNTCYCNALFGLDRGFARYEDYYENQSVSLFETVRSSGLGKRVLQGLGYSIRPVDGETTVRKTAEMLNRDVLGWLSGRRADQPFFLFINYFDAHTPYILHGAPDPLFGLAALPLAEQAAIDQRYLDVAGRGKPVPAGFSSQQIVNDAMTMYSDSYDSCIAHLDRQFGLLLDELERRGLMENTLTIVTSDHGELLGEHALLGHGLSLYRPEVHVPLLVIPPARSSTAGVVTETVSIREIPATVAEWVGLGPRSPFPGHSLTRFLKDDKERSSEPSPVLTEVQHIQVNPRTEYIPSSVGPVSSIVAPDRVYIRGEGAREELYDRSIDPYELDNLVQDPQSQPVLHQLRKELTRLCPRPNRAKGAMWNSRPGLY